jgi:mucin-19
MGGYIGPGIATQVDGYNKTQADARYPQMTGPTGAEALPTGTTAQRPSNPNTGYTRYNTDIGSIETWNGTAWVTSGGLVLQAVQTTNFTAVAGNSYPVNTTSGAITVALPASPAAGQQVNVFDYAGTAATNAITINPNGGKINAAASNAVISTVRASVTLVYVDSTQGWVDTAIGNSSYIPQPYSISYVATAGGGGGGGSSGDAVTGGGGAGAGGMLVGSFVANLGTSYSITIGGGGGGGGQGGNGGQGGSTSLGSIFTCIGGGAGRHADDSNVSISNGGSGGGGSGSSGAGPGSGTAGQGNNGGGQNDGNGGQFVGGGGGGKGSAGSGRTAGSGLASSITGSSVTYAAGGYGQGTSNYINAGVSGAANTGNGGNGAYSGSANGGNGGSGVVILSVPTVNYTGVTTGSPTVTTSGSNTIIKFTSSGSYTA